MKSALLAMLASVMTTSRGAMVRITHKACSSQVFRNLKKNGLMSLNLVSYPALRTLLNRKKPSLPDQTTTMHAATICLAYIPGILVKVAIKVIEM